MGILTYLKSDFDQMTKWPWPQCKKILMQEKYFAIYSKTAFWMLYLCPRFGKDRCRGCKNMPGIQFRLLQGLQKRAKIQGRVLQGMQWGKPDSGQIIAGSEWYLWTVCKWWHRWRWHRWQRWHRPIFVIAVGESMLYIYHFIYIIINIMINK